MRFLACYWSKEMELACPVNKLGMVTVFQAMHHVGGCEDDAARAYWFGFAVVEVFEVSGLDEENLGVGMLVGRVRHLAGGQHRLVDLEVLAGLDDSGHDRALFATVGVFVHR